jgi:hypothetical protein
MGCFPLFSFGHQRRLTQKVSLRTRFLKLLTGSVMHDLLDTHGDLPLFLQSHEMGDHSRPGADSHVMFCLVVRSLSDVTALW